MTSGRKTPYVALIVPGIIGFPLSLTGQGDLLILVAVFGATVSYVMMMASHIALRIREPHLDRAYRTPGGVHWALPLCSLSRRDRRVPRRSARAHRRRGRLRNLRGAFRVTVVITSWRLHRAREDEII